MKKALAAAGVVALAALTLSACGSDDTSTIAPAPAPVSSSAPATESATPAPTESMVGGDPSTWTPLGISINDNNGTLDMVVGQAAVWTDLPQGQENQYRVECGDPKVVEAVQPQGPDSSYTSTAGIVAKAPGKTNVVLYNGDQPVMQFTAVVTEQPTNDGDPGGWGPTMLTNDQKSVNMVVGETAIWDSLPKPGKGEVYNVGVTDPNVIEGIDGVPMQSGIVGFKAKAPGTATVTVYNGYPGDGDAPVVTEINVTVGLFDPMTQQQ